MKSDDADAPVGVGAEEDMDSVWADLDALSDSGWGAALPLASPSSMSADFLPAPHSAVGDVDAFRAVGMISPLGDDQSFIAIVPSPPHEAYAAGVMGGEGAGGGELGELVAAEPPTQAPPLRLQAGSSSKRHAPLGQWLTPPQMQFPSSATSTRRGVGIRPPGLPIAPVPPYVWPHAAPTQPLAPAAHGPQSGYTPPPPAMLPYSLVAARMQGGPAMAAGRAKIEHTGGEGHGSPLMGPMIVRGPPQTWADGQQGRALLGISGPVGLKRDISSDTEWDVTDSFSPNDRELGGLRRQPYSCPDLSLLTSMALATTLDSPSTGINTPPRAAEEGLGGVDIGPLLHFTSASMPMGMDMAVEQQQLSKLRAIVSCPDMLRGGPQAFRRSMEQGLDERRQTRLARNRAAARERRLKAKNQIEAYEQEAASLEGCMNEVRAHAWGGGGGREDVEAMLGHDKPSALLMGEESRQEIGRALDRLLEHLELLRDDAMVMEVLSAAVGGGGGVPGAAGQPQPDAAIAGLAADLMRELQLGPQQAAAIGGVLGTGGGQLDALSQVETGLKALRVAAAQQAKGAIEAALGLVKGVLDPEQINGLLDWSDQNRVAISSLALSAYGSSSEPAPENQSSDNEAPDTKLSSRADFVFDRAPAGGSPAS